MRSKNILSVVAFTTAFALSAAFASLFITKTQTESIYVPVNGNKSTSCFKFKNKSPIANKISALIREDNRNGRESNRAFYSDGADIFSPSADSALSGYAEAVEQYVDSSSSMKADDLPGDFQTEWREHMKAWRGYSEFLNRTKNVSSRKSLTPEELNEVDNFHSREIDRTYEKVLQTGAIYGADVY